MNNKLISAVLLAWIASTGFAWISSADDTQVTTSTSESSYGFEMKKGKHMRGMNHLSEEDKALLEDMDETEKQEFFEQKREEYQAKRELQESVIDDLLAGNTLTAEQESVRAEMITQRAERKAQMLEKQEQRETMRAIMEKKEAGEELTQEEQELVDSFAEKHKGKWIRWGKFNK